MIRSLFDQELVENPASRVPVCLCLDTSGTMYGHPINELNAGVRMFYSSIKHDDMARASADISIVSFGWNGVQCIQNFSGVDGISNPPSLQADGMTPMGEAVNLSLDLLEARKKAYKKAGVEYYQPWLVLMTDGQPNGNMNEQIRAQRRVQEMVLDRKLTVFAIGVGNDADMNMLKQFSPRRVPLRLKGLKFREFFQWLSQSVARVSVSQIGETVALDIGGIEDWRVL